MEKNTTQNDGRRTRLGGLAAYTIAGAAALGAMFTGGCKGKTPYSVDMERYNIYNATLENEADQPKTPISRPSEITTVAELERAHEGLIDNFAGTSRDRIGYIAQRANELSDKAGTKEERRVAKDIYNNTYSYLAESFLAAAYDTSKGAPERLAFLTLARDIYPGNAEIDETYDTLAPGLKKTIKEIKAPKGQQDGEAQFKSVYNRAKEKYHAVDKVSENAWAWLPRAIENYTPFYIGKHVRDAVVHSDSFKVPSRKGLEARVKEHSDAMTQEAANQGWTTAEGIHYGFKKQFYELGKQDLKALQALNEAIDKGKENDSNLDDLDRRHQNIMAYRHLQLAKEAGMRGDYASEEANLLAAQVLVGASSRKEPITRFIRFRQDRLKAEDKAEGEKDAEKKMLEKRTEIVAIPYGDEAKEAKVEFWYDVLKTGKDVAQTAAIVGAAAGGSGGGGGGGGGSSGGGGSNPEPPPGPGPGN